MAFRRRRLLAPAAAGTGGVTGCLEDVPGHRTGGTSGADSGPHCPAYRRWSVSLETPLSDPAVLDGTVYVATENRLVALRDG